MKTKLFTRHQRRYAASLNILYRSLLIALFVLLVSYTTNANPDTCVVKLLVIDNQNNEPIPFANLVAYQNGVQVAVGHTDLDGRFTMRRLAPGKYDFKAVYVGYIAQEVKGVEVFAAKQNWLNIKLKVGDYVITCCCYCNCYRDDTEDWWPKLWTPYREGYKAWKEKKEKKKALAAKQQKKKEIREEEDTETLIKMDSIEVARMEITAMLAEELKIYPNPASDILHVESARPLQNVSLMDANGKLLKEEQVQNTALDIQLSGLTSGVYYLNYVLDGKTESKKVVVVAP